MDSFYRSNHTANSVIGRFNATVAASLAPFRGKKFIVGVSGGADSVALLRAMHSLRIDMVAVNCNFNLRGDESDGDSDFVAELCDSLGIRLVAANFDTLRLRQSGESVEMTCRRLRYELFERLMAEYNAVRIAVAHNADDNVETLFLNLMRGAGLRGLAAMPVNSGNVIRPLLSISRGQILDYLEALGQGYRTDSSNLDSGYRRNFIRNEVLPLLRTRWEGAAQSITRSIANLRSALSLIDNNQSPIITALLDAPEGEWFVIPYSELQASGDLRALCWQIISILGGNAKRSDELSVFLRQPKPLSGKVWDFPMGKIVSGRKGLGILKGESEDSDSEIVPFIEGREIVPDTEDSAFVTSPNGKYTCTVLPYSADLDERIRRASNDEVWLPGTPDDYIIRRPQSGDRMAPFGMRGTKLVSDIINDAKVEPWDKDTLFVVADRRTASIVWLCGLRRSRHNLVTSNTRCVTHIKELRIKELRIKD